MPRRKPAAGEVHVTETSGQHQGGVVLTIEQAAAAARIARESGEVVVMCHGCFDIIHPGHIRHLQFAAALGDRLLVTITGDDAVRKGQGRPLIGEQQRAANLAALSCVDLVAIDPNPTAVANLRLLRPDIYVKGHEYEGSRHPGFLAEKAVVEAYGGRVVLSPGDVVFSSTALIDALGREEDAPPDTVAPSAPAAPAGRMKNGSGWESNPPGT
jgi:rfaE bifunctional protein nucleotidyltransferase chain/domain